MHHLSYMQDGPANSRKNTEMLYMQDCPAILGHTQYSPAYNKCINF